MKRALSNIVFKMKYTFSSVIVCLCLCLISALPAEPIPKPCSTAACKKAAEYLIESLNATADPCHNFYEYACGGWLSRQMPDDKVVIGPPAVLNDEMNDGIRALLDKFNVTTDGKSSAGSVAFSAYVYHQCVALGAESNETGLDALKNVVKSILSDRTWDIGREVISSNVEHSWSETFVRILLAGVPNLFSLTSLSANSTNNIMLLEPGVFGLGYQELKNLTAYPKQVSAYKKYIRSSGKLFCGDKCNATLLDRDIDDIVKLESELAMNTLPVEEARQVEGILHNVFTFKQLKEKSKLDWLTSVFVPIEKALGMSSLLTETSQITVTEPIFTFKALEILAKTPQRTLTNYFGWRIVSHFGQYSSEQFGHIKFDFLKANQGAQKMQKRKEKCYHLAYGQLDMALSRLYVDHFSSEKKKKKAAEMIDSIQTTLHSMLEHNQWLDPETKKKSLNKLSHVTKNVAYPEWLLHNEQLDEFYLLQNKTEVQNLLANKNYFLSLTRFSALQLKKVIINSQVKTNVDKMWPIVPAVINAGFYYMQNSITLPAVMMKSPQFDGERPFSLNYGGIGMIIGHEFTHGFDDQGRKFDEYGNLHNWWSAEALTRYKSRGECFVQQYGSQVEKTSGLHLNGKNGLGENIADNGGLHIAFQAFQAQQAKSSPSPTLADLPKLTSEQLYFLAFANNFCAQIRPEILKFMVMYDSHAPSEYRVNIPVSNLPEFSKAFNCPVGSPMNPSKKCTMW